MSDEEKVEEDFIPNAEEVAMCLEIRENLKKANVEAGAVVVAAVTQNSASSSRDTFIDTPVGEVLRK